MFPDTTAIVFVPLLAGTMMVLYVALVFGSHYFLTIVECTAHGQRDIQWPNEMVTDWLGKPLRLIWIGGIYLLPAVLMSAWLGRVAGTPYLTIALTALAFALLFPLGAVSVFIARSSWTVFHPRTLPMLLSKPALSGSFFLAAFATSLAGLAGFFLAIFSKEIGRFSAVVGSILGTLALFAYACVLGRLLFALTYVPPPPKKKRKKRTVETDPLPVQPEPEPHWERPPPTWDPDRDERPYEAHAAEIVTKEVHPEIARPKESEMKLLERTPPAPPPGFAFGPDAFKPIVQNETMRNAIVLAMILALLSGLVRMLIDLNPAKPGVG